MQSEHHKHNPRSGITSFSAEEEFAEACRASAEAYRNMRNRVRMRFHEAQQEAYISWAAWDEEAS